MTARPLHDLEAERSYIAWGFLDAALLDQYPVDVEQLFEARYQLVLAAMHELREQGQPVDTIAVRRVLELRGKLQAAGGDEGLLRITNQAPATFVSTTAPRIRELATLRETRKKLALALEACNEARLAAALDLVNDVSDRARIATQHEILTGGQCVEHAITAYRTLDDSPSVAAIAEPTGMANFDAVIEGFGPEDWLTIGAETNVGKSWVALTNAVARAKLGRRTGIISLEDPKKRWGTRLAAALSGISATTLKGRKVGRDDFPKVANAVAEAHRLGIVIGYALDGNIYRVIDTMRALVLDHGCTFLELDYAQNLEGDELAGETTHTSFSRRYTKLRRAIERLGVPLAVLSQVKRDKASRRGPSRGDLKEGGNLENKSDYVVMLRRDTKRKNVIHAVIDKSKDGGNGVSWEYEQQRSGLLVESDPIRDEDFSDGTPVPQDSDLYERALAKKAKPTQQTLPGAAE